MDTVVKPVHAASRQANDSQILAPFQAIFTLGLIAATWGLWTTSNEFPRVPLLSWGCLVPEVVSSISLWCVLAGCAAAIACRRGALSRVSWGIVAIGLGVLFVLNQHRLQPWAYQTFLAAMLFACGRRESQDRWLRCLVISIYAYSALGKFDYQFLHSLGQDFLRTILGAIGIPFQAWPEGLRVKLALVFPIGELFVAVVLAIPATRRVGVWCAVALHVVLIATLGPLGLGHRLGVLLWNAFFIVQAYCLFWPRSKAGPLIGSAPPARNVSLDAPAEIAPDLAQWLVNIIFLGAIILPAFNLVDRWDHWLSWGLYSPGNSRALVFLQRTSLGELPEDLRKTLVSSPQVEQNSGDATPALEGDMGIASDKGQESPWVELRIDRWSLAMTGAPIYPQDRFQLGVAIAVADEFELQGKIRVVLESASDRRTGLRRQRVLTNWPQLKMAAGEFRWNALPCNRP